MTRTVEQINQEAYIHLYLSGRPLPSPALRAEAEQWMRDLIDDPDLEQAEDIINAAVPDTTPLQFQMRAQSAVPAATTQAPVRRKASLWNVVTSLIFCAVMVAITVSAVFFGGSSRLFGYQFFEVLSGSMQQMIPQGSLVISQAVPASEIQVGDVITFLRGDKKTVTHQVIEVVPNHNGAGAPGFRTKGTENPGPDPDIVDAGDVIGVVKTHVKGLGLTLRRISENILWVFIGFTLLLLLFFALRMLLGKRTAFRGKSIDTNKDGARLTAETAAAPPRHAQALRPAWGNAA